MSVDVPIEQLIDQIADMDRDDCIVHLRLFEEPALDFTNSYLASQSDEQLRHILLAACLQARKKNRRLAG